MLQAGDQSYFLEREVMPLAHDSVVKFVNGSTVTSQNKYGEGTNNYGAFTLGDKAPNTPMSGTFKNNSVTVDASSSVSTTGNSATGTNQYVAYSYGGSENTVNIAGPISVTDNKNNLWFGYSQSGAGDGLHVDLHNSCTVELTEEALDGAYAVTDEKGKIVNLTSDLETALQVAEKAKTNSIITDTAIIEIGADAPVPADEVEIPAGITVDTSKNAVAADRVKPAADVVVIYGNANEPNQSLTADTIATSLKVSAAGFNAKAADAKAALDKFLEQDGKTVADTVDNTMYAVLDRRAAGDSLMVVVKNSNGDAVYWEKLPRAALGARAFYFIFPAEDSTAYAGGSPAAKKLAAGKYTVGLYKATDAAQAAPIGDALNIELYAVHYKAGTGVTGSDITVFVDKKDLEAAKAARPESFAPASGYDWGSPSIAEDAANYTLTVTFTGNRIPSGGGGGGGSSSSGDYLVSVDKTTHGKVTVSPNRADKGDTVTITVKADKGYELDELTVTDKSGKEIKLTEKADNKFTFKMPGSKVTVAASFQQIGTEPEVPVFVDVPADAYYADAVAWAVKNGITDGTSANTFSPDMNCTRGQMVTFLWRANGSPKAATANPFTDVSSGAYYYDAVLWAAEKGITNGTSATTFSPDMVLTRGQTVTFLWRANGSPAASGSSFGDVAPGAWYANAVAWAAAEDITQGTGGNNFSPNADCTRAQIVTFMHRNAQ